VKRFALTATALVALAGCYELPDRAGALVDACVRIDAAAYAEARESGRAWNAFDLRGGSFAGEGAGHSKKRCWPRVMGMNSPDRRCVQTNDLVVSMQTDAETSYFSIPARTTYALYGEGGVAQCRIVQED
jgi:hypothetical protein